MSIHKRTISERLEIVLSFANVPCIDSLDRDAFINLTKPRQSKNFVVEATIQVNSPIASQASDNNSTIAENILPEINRSFTWRQQ